MRRTLQTLVVLAMFATPAFADDRVAGTVVAIDGDAYTVDLGGEAAVSSGTELQVYRRLPSGRGTAAYRDSPVWWEVGRLTVRAVGEGIAIAVWSGPPSDVLPSGLDESGAPPDQVHIGDRVRATGSIGARPARVRVSFALRDLFEPQSQDLQGEGSALLAEWLRGIRSIEGPLEIEVHPRIAELGEVGPDLSRELSREIDAPFGPAPGEPVVPVDGLYEGAPTPVLIPEGREVLVVDQRDGKPDVWHYLDPVTMARRQGERVASALSAHLGISPELVVVRVVPRPTTTHDMAVKTPGYDAPVDQLRILATSIEWAEAPVVAPRRTPKEQPEVDEEPTKPRHKRRLLERPAEDVS